MNEEASVPVEVVAPTPMTTEEWSSRWADFQGFANSQLIDGTDFGTIPGVKKPSLWKAGAEKVSARYLVRPHIVKEDKVEDWDAGLFCFDTTVELRRIDSGIVMGEGVGSCNSYEEKYRYTWLSKAKLGDRTDYVESRKKKGRYGEYTEYKVERKDLASIRNTVQKMAFKRAFVAAALTLSCASQIFTQDVEDFEDAKIVNGKSTSHKKSEFGGETKNKPSSEKTPLKKQTNATGLAPLELSTDHELTLFQVKQINGLRERINSEHWNQALEDLGLKEDQDIKTEQDGNDIIAALKDSLKTS